jgi:phytoene synthase
MQASSSQFPLSPGAPDLRQAYEFCRQTARTHAKSFYFSAQFLPREKRQAIYAVYALCRHVDDAVDARAVHDSEGAREAVAAWQSDLDRVFQGERLSSPVLLAWSDMLTRYTIKQELPLELMRGVLMDTHIKRYETWEDLRLYCYRVASVVGLMVTEIFGYARAETLRYAESLGTAMQLTNILRDVGEDLRVGRVYLPQEDLRRFDYSEAELRRGEVNARFVSLMRFEIERARSLYREAERGIPFLHRDARFTVLLAARIYARILNRIEDNLFDVFSHRAHLSFAGKVRLVPRIWRESRSL